ncbi:MAG: hypothetical protein ABIG56_01275, partial [Candidatus Omnitrophota bacterium]
MLRGFVGGMVKGGMLGGSQIIASDFIKHTNWYNPNDQNSLLIANQAASLLGGALGTTAFNLVMAGAGFNLEMKIPRHLKDIIEGKDMSVQRELNALTASTMLTVDEMDSFTRTLSGSVSFSPDGWLQSLKASAYTILPGFLDSAISLTVERYLGQNAYSSSLGKFVGGSLSNAFGQLLTQDNLRWEDYAKGIGTGVLDSAVKAALSYGLSSIGGEFDKTTELNRLGLSKFQMAALNFMGTAAVGSMVGLGSVNDYLGNFGNNLGSMGGTASFYSKGAGGWTETQYIQKMAEFNGISGLPLNVDFAMHSAGMNSWGEFRDAGGLGKILPSFANSLVRNAASTLHQSAVDNLAQMTSYAASYVWNGGYHPQYNERNELIGYMKGNNFYDTDKFLKQSTHLNTDGNTAVYSYDDEGYVIQSALYKGQVTLSSLYGKDKNNPLSTLIVQGENTFFTEGHKTTVTDASGALKQTWHQNTNGNTVVFNYGHDDEYGTIVTQSALYGIDKNNPLSTIQGGNIYRPDNRIPGGGGMTQEDATGKIIGIGKTDANGRTPFYKPEGDEFKLIGSQIKHVNIDGNTEEFNYDDKNDFTHSQLFGKDGKLISTIQDKYIYRPDNRVPGEGGMTREDIMGNRIGIGKTDDQGRTHFYTGDTFELTGYQKGDQFFAVDRETPAKETLKLKQSVQRFDDGTSLVNIYDNKGNLSQ